MNSAISAKKAYYYILNMTNILKILVYVVSRRVAYPLFHVAYSEYFKFFDNDLC